MFRWVVILNGMIGWALSAQSAQLSTDLLVFVPKNIAQTIAGQVTGSYRLAIPKVTVPGTIPMNLENFDLDLTYQLKTLNLGALSAFETNLEFVKARLRVSAVLIDAVTEKVIDGVVVRVVVKVDCRNAVVENRIAIPFSGSGKVRQSPLSAQLDNINWLATGQDWQFTAEKCEGNADPATIEGLINQFFSTSAELKKQVLERTNSQLANWFENNRNWAQPFPQFNSVVATRADEILDNGQSWVLRLGVTMTPLMNCPSFEKEPTVPPPPTTPGPAGIELQLPTRATILIAQCLHEMGHLYRRDLSSEMKGFKDFMGSWVKKFIYWGDLLRFPGDAEFVFLSKTVGEFVFLPKEIKDKKSKGATRLLFEGEALIESQMKYRPSEGDPQPYVTFYTAVSGQMSLDTDYTKPHLPTQFVIQARGKPVSRLSYKWDVNTEYLRDTGINTTAMNDELMKTLGASSLQFELAPLMITDSHQINVVGIKTNGETTQLQLQINPRLLNDKAVDLYLSAEPVRLEASPN